MNEVYAETPGAGKQIIENATQRAIRHKTPLTAPPPAEVSVNKKIRKDLQNELRRIGISYSDLARKTGLDESAVRRIITGKIKTPPFSKVFALYAVLGLPLPISQTMPKKKRITAADLIKTTAKLISYPRKPNRAALTKAESVVEALILSGAIDVK